MILFCSKVLRRLPSNNHGTISTIVVNRCRQIAYVEWEVVRAFKCFWTTLRIKGETFCKLPFHAFGDLVNLHRKRGISLVLTGAHSIGWHLYSARDLYIVLQFLLVLRLASSRPHLPHYPLPNNSARHLPTMLQ
jgi:hypothetical protein